MQLVGRARGYMLEVDPETVDVHQFRRLRRQADALAASGDHDHAAALLREADGLWRGQALAGIRGDWVARMRDALEEERRAAILERVGCELELGRHADLVGELRQLLAQYPLDETLVGHQMTALYRSGRPADALSLYRETRSRLVDEQGAEPGRGAVRAASAHPEPRPRAGRAALRPAPGPGGAAATPCRPRRRSSWAATRNSALLTGERGASPAIAIIEGMPGVGKTALAIRAARLVADSTRTGRSTSTFIPMIPRSPSLDPAEALYRLLQMLSVPAAQIPDTIGERTALWRAQLSRRRAVVILDDAAGHDQLRPLLPATGRCLILITTRRRLPDLGGARSLTLDVLPVDEAVALFRRIAGETEPGDDGQIAAAVQRAAGCRSRSSSPPAGSAQAHRLTAVLCLSPGRGAGRSRPGGSGGAGAAGPEVTAAFDLSYGALEPDHQQFFRRLGVSPCATFGLPAVAALGGCTHAEAEKALVTLLDYHLLTRAPGGPFRFHDLIRGYAAARAARDDPAAEQRQAVGRLLDYYLHAADQADRVLRPFRRRRPGAGQPAASREPGSHREDAASWLESEWRNILQAARYAGRHEWKAEVRRPDRPAGRLHGDQRVLGRGDRRPRPGPAGQPRPGRPGRIARAALALSAVRQQTGQHEAAIPLAEEAAAIYRSLADRSGEAEALDQLGLAYQRMARSRESLAYFEEARMLYGAPRTSAAWPTP